MNDWQQSENEVICKVAGIIVRNRKLLLTRTRGTDLFLSPGGKPLAGEDPEEALRRELAEETGLVTIQADYFGRFEGISAFEPTKKIVMDTYQVIVGVIHFRDARFQSLSGSAEITSRSGLESALSSGIA